MLKVEVMSAMWKVVAVVALCCSALRGVRAETRCGICPTYFRKLCAYDAGTHQTYIFDNQCLMDLYNCINKTQFSQIRYDKCLYFGNFAYVHGFKYEDQDYGDDHVAKNPDFL